MKIQASNQANVTINWLVYATNHPFPVTLSLVCITAGIIIAATNWPRAGQLGLAFILIFTPLMMSFGLISHFKNGDVNPGIVICENPFMIAVIADMSIDPDSLHYPAIKIISPPKPFKYCPIDHKFVTVAMYKGTGQDGIWSDLNPRLLDSVTSNKKVKKNLFDSVPEWQWDALEQGVKQLDDPKKWEIYSVDVDWISDQIEIQDLEAEMQDNEQVTENSRSNTEQASDNKTKRRIVSFVCKGCDHEYHVPVKYSGRTVRCKKCDTMTVIPMV